MGQINIRETGETYLLLQKIASLKGVNVSEIIRDAIRSSIPGWLHEAREAQRKKLPYAMNPAQVALAKEASHPGSVSTRALWCIGTIDEYTFTELCDVVRLYTAIKYGDGECWKLFTPPTLKSFPTLYDIVNKRFAVLSEFGLMWGSFLMEIAPAALLKVSEDMYILDFPTPVKMDTPMLTDLGNELASLLEVASAPDARTLFDSRIRSLDISQFRLFDAKKSGPGKYSRGAALN